jgi:hypothetical protein
LKKAAASLGENRPPKNSRQVEISETVFIQRFLNNLIFTGPALVPTARGRFDLR